jgi:small neutral amino acid transporter SnatA (MarC family)
METKFTETPSLYFFVISYGRLSLYFFGISYRTFDIHPSMYLFWINYSMSLLYLAQFVFL